uniref:Uncharacterized protein n=1 Tax=viral metagenome TaxID=1070528 RepID=A0A6C0K563_9ZZZZ
MKVAFIFRGDNVREEYADKSRKYIDALKCHNNWKLTLFDDILASGGSYDTVFITYDSPILDDIKALFNPVHIETMSYRDQPDNFKKVLKFISDNKDKYDRFVILRCDFMYKLRITQWPKWFESGITLVNKDVHYPKQRLYSDILFIIDSNISIDSLLQIQDSMFHYGTVHRFGTALESNNISFNLMYDDYYHLLGHPLYTVASIQEEPDLDKYEDGVKVTDVSQWN